MPAIDVEALRRAEFPVTRDWAYLDTSTYGPHPNRYVRAMAEAAERLAASPAGNAAEVIDQVRARAARLLNVPSERLALLHGTSEGVGLIARGLEWRSGDEVILYEREFPGAMAPWLALAGKGVRVRVIHERGRDGFEPEDVAAALSDRTRAICLSLVNNVNGFRPRLDAVRDLCAGRDVWLAWDAVQALGALEVDAAALGGDVVAAHGYKFLLSGFGYAAVALSERAMAELAVPSVGVRNLRVPESAALLRDGVTYPDHARRFEVGVQNLPAMAAMAASLALLEEVGPAAIEAHVMALARRLADGLVERGWNVAGHDRPETASHVVVAGRDGVDPEAAEEHFRRRGIACAVRDGRVRFSLHLFCNRADVDAALDAATPGD